MKSVDVAKFREIHVSVAILPQLLVVDFWNILEYQFQFHFDATMQSYTMNSIWII